MSFKQIETLLRFYAHFRKIIVKVAFDVLNANFHKRPVLRLALLSDSLMGAMPPISPPIFCRLSREESRRMHS